MTPAQFAALAELIRLRGGPAPAGAELVLVHGLGVQEAAARVGCSRQNVGNTLRRARAGLRLARLAAGLPAEADAAPD